MKKKLLIAIIFCFAGGLFSTWANPQKKCVTVDFLDNIWKSYKTAKASPGNGTHSTQNIDQMMEIFSKLGFAEVFWIYNYNDHLQIEIIDSKTNKPLSEKLFLKYLVDSAHRAGMKLFMVVKPFESASSTAFPQPYFEAFKNTGLENINGYYPNLDEFILKNPDYRIKRKPVDKRLEKLAVTSIKLIGSSAEEVPFSKTDFKLYTSETNGKFSEYNKPFTLQTGLENRNGKKVYILTIKDLLIPPKEKYIWVEYVGKKQEKKFHNQQNKIMELYSGTQVLPVTNSITKITLEGIYSRLDHLRANFISGNTKAWSIKIPRDYGFKGNIAFQFGYGPWISQICLDTKPDARQGYIAVCRGKQKYLNGLHPAYPQVRQYWLSQLDKLIEAGVDGIDLRADSHSTWTQEGEDYGFNEPVIKEFRKRYGVDVLTQTFDFGKWKDLQAEYFTAFLKEAKKRTTAAKIPLFAHVSYLMVRYFPRKLNNLPENFSWPWKSWIKDDIIDGVTIKYIPWPWGKKRGQGKELVHEIAGYAKQYNKQVYLNVRLECWWMQLSAKQRKTFPLKEKDIKRVENAINWAWQQKQVDAINLYEANDFLLRDHMTKKVTCSNIIAKILKTMK
jgi:hypothetical protein